jgi:hypothetical protein
MREVDAMLRTVSSWSFGNTGNRFTTRSTPLLTDVLGLQDLVNITDQFIYADLREADLRAGHWVDEDPPLATILLWINSQP